MSKARVLIVEDEALIAEDMRWQLMKGNFEVAGMADSGEEAIAMADDLRPDLVLMDIQLRGALSGWDAGRLLKQEMDLLVIYVSATIREPSPANCISKPFTIAKLSACLEGSLLQRS